AANAKGEAAAQPSKPMNSRRCISMTPSPRTMPSIAGQRRASQQKRAHSCPLWAKSEKLDLSNQLRFTPESEQRADMLECPLCAKIGLMQCKNSLSAIIRDGYYEPAEVVIGELLRKSACTDASFVVD